MRAGTTLLIALVLLAGCAGDGASPSPASTVFGFGLPEAAASLPVSVPFVEGRLAPGGGTIFEPSSVAITHGQSYRFSLGHCGLFSPVDVDGSFWDEVGGVDVNGMAIDLASDTEMINATLGLLIVVGDQAFFRTDSGTVVTFARHDGEKEFPGCA